MKKPFIQAVILVVVAFVVAVATNAVASRQRKLTLVGWYPSATAVARVAAAAPARREIAPATMPMATTTTAEAAVAIPTAAPAQQPAKTKPRQPVKALPAPDVLARFQVHPDKPYIEIAFDDVKALHGKGVLFLDARRTSVYEQGHIVGARPFSVWESDIDDKVRKLFDERSDESAQALPIVIYCSGGDCEDSHMLAQKLWGIQFNNVYVYKDGFPDWEKHRGAVHPGPNP